MDLPKLDIGKLENISDSSFTDTLKDDFDTINDTLNLTEKGARTGSFRFGGDGGIRSIKEQLKTLLK